MNSIVVHYQELALKGKNRPRFEKTLCENLERALAPLGKAKVRRLYGRILVDAPEGASEAAVAERLQRVFGVAYFSVASTVEPTRAAIERLVDEFTAARSFASFGVRVRRVDKTLPFRSHELAAELGARIQARTGARVPAERGDLGVELLGLLAGGPQLRERVERARTGEAIERGPLHGGREERLVRVLPVEVDERRPDLRQLRDRGESAVHVRT